MRQKIPGIVVWLYILLFAYTSTSKFLDYNLFVAQMLKAPLPLMHFIAPILGLFIPLLEALLVVGLLIKPTRYKALIASTILMVAFELYIAAMLATHQHLPCTCGGIISTMSWKAHLLFNGGFIVLGLLSLAALKQHHTQTSSGDQNIKELFRA